MTDDLAAFLKARLDEDEAAAKAARAEYFRPEVLSQFSAVSDMYHVIRHDPARVLREVEAKRRILQEVVAQIDDMDARIESEWGSGGYHATGESDLLLKLLALPYSDHSEYRQEWKP